MILAQEVNNRMLSKLDAESDDRFLFDQDIKPAINGAIETLVTWLNQAFADKKLSPENLRDLTYVKVWQANSYSRVAFNEAEVGHSLWSVIAIYPKPITNKKNVVTPATTNNSVSRFRDDLAFVKSRQSAKRLSMEEWNENADNAFMPGNNVLKGTVSEYGYLDPANYSSTTYPSSADAIEWTIRPDIPNEVVAIAYIKYPTPITVIGGSLEFPKSLTELIVDLALNNIAYKEGTQNLYAMTTQNINRLVSLIK